MKFDLRTGSTEPNTYDSLVTTINRSQIFIWMLIAFFLMPNGSHFLYDEAFYYHEVMQILKGERFPAFGPFVSGSNPTAFTPGAGVFLLYMPPFIFSSDPRAAPIWLAILSFLALNLFDWALRRCAAEPSLRLFSITLLTWSFWHFMLSDRMWNVNVFYFTSLCLLSLTIYACHLGHLSKRLAIGFGIIAAFLFQIHLGGSLAVMVCGLFVLLYCMDSWKKIPYMALGFGAMYLPYLGYEFTHGFENLINLSRAIPEGGGSTQALRSLISIPRFASHIKDLESLRSGLAITSLIVSFIFLALGFTRFHPYTLAAAIIAVGIPLYLQVTHRPYLYHYVASVIPYIILLPALGMCRLSQWGKLGRGLAVSYALFFSASGIYLAFTHFKEPHASVRNFLVTTEQAIAKGEPITAKKRAPDSFIIWTLAQSYYKKDLTFRAEDKRQCNIVIDPSPEGEMVMEIDQAAFFVCSSDKAKAAAHL